MKHIATLTGIAVLALAALAACGGDDDDAGASATATPGGATINPADFSATIDNPYFPLSNVTSKVFEGETTDPDTGETVPTRLESNVLTETETVAGVEVLVLQEKAYEDGELIEDALDYFAQHTDGSVYYFGERVDNYEDGEVKDHNGSWLAGENGNLPGIIMPAAPTVGETVSQENAPGIAEDKAKFLSLDESVSTPAGDFTGCVKTEDFNPLETPIVYENKFYCEGAGLVREEEPEGFSDLISY